MGNITVGGTGKTPTTELVALGLQKRGFKTAILSRGYKGKKDSDVNLVSDGDKIYLGPQVAGDEPYMLAKRLKGIPVVVGSDRYKIGQFAEEKFDLDALILDDGFQHIRLHRDLNILLVDGKRGFGNGFMLPRGPLREPLSAMQRADMILMNKADSLLPGLEESIKKISSSKEYFKSHYEATRLLSLWEKAESPLNIISGAKVIALSAIATPSSFTNLLSSMGGTVVSEVSFSDHHHYEQKDLDVAVEKAKNSGADFIVTTEKDAVKLSQLKEEKDLPIYFIEIALAMAGGQENFINSIIKISGLEEKKFET